MASPDERVLKSQLAAESVLRRTKIDRMIKAKIADGADTPKASKKHTTVTPPLDPTPKVNQKHS